MTEKKAKTKNKYQEHRDKDWDFDFDLFNLLHDVKNPFKGDENPHFKSKFAGLASCLKTIKPALQSNNFALQQIVKQLESGGSILQTNLIHITGKVVSDGGIPLVSKDANDPQKLGGSITYARRYGMCALLGIVGDEDDDGNLASEPDTKAIRRLKQEFTDTLAESTDKKMLDELYVSYKEEIEALDKEEQAWFKKQYKEQFYTIKEREEKDADS